MNRRGTLQTQNTNDPQKKYRLKTASKIFYGRAYLLLSPYICFISLLYLDSYVIGDDALIS